MYDPHFSSFGRPPFHDDLSKDSAPRHPRFWRRFLNVFTIYGHGRHLGQWQGWAVNSTPGIYQWYLPVFTGLENTPKVANTGQLTSRTILAILVVGHPRNISEKLF